MPELLPPNRKSISPPSDTSVASFQAAWHQATPIQKGIFISLSSGSVLSATLFALGLFFQTRGVQSMLASRVFLIIAVFLLAAFAWQFGAWLKPKNWQWYALFISLVLFLAAYVLDRAFPMPKIPSQAITPSPEVKSQRSSEEPIPKPEPPRREPKKQSGHSGPPANPCSDEHIDQCSCDQLRERILRLVKQVADRYWWMPDQQKKLQETTDPEIARELRYSITIQTNIMVRDYYQHDHAEAVKYRDEVINRLGPGANDEHVSYDNVNAYSDLRNIVADLERLAALLRCSSDAPS